MDARPSLFQFRSFKWQSRRTGWVLFGPWWMSWGHPSHRLGLSFGWRRRV